jgi:PAS domain S-box-containing protein
MEMSAFKEVLRQQAEAVLRNQPHNTANAYVLDPQLLVQELQVHEVELQLQNEELRRSQQELQRARDQYAMLYDFAPSGYLTLDAAGTIVAANLTAATMLGVTRAALVGTPLSRFLVRDDQDSLYLHRRQVFEVDTLETCDLRLQRPDGTVLVVSLQSRRIKPGDSQAHQCLTILSDITSRRRTEEALQRAEQLALVGQLAAGLAHEIGTPLNLISGNSELLCMDLHAQHLPTETVEVIMRQADRIIGLVQQLLTLGRPEPPARRPLSLRALVEDVLPLMARPFQRDLITVVLDIPDDFPLLWGVRDQIEQVLLNVMVNAWHAMPTGGIHTITARKTSGKLVRVTMRDTGVGMESADVARAFEPFYTSKGSQGTGLGLTICQQIIEAHEGYITLESTPGVGTAVHLDLVCAPGSGECFGEGVLA